MRTVSVACKLPNGLVLSDNVQLFGPGVGPPPFNFVANKVAESDGRERVAGYALNHDVDAEVWEKWAKDHKDSDLLKKRLLVVDENPAVLRARVSALAGVKSGFEQAERKE